MGSEFNSTPSKKQILGAIIMLIGVGICFIGIGYRLSHPDMTEVRALFNTWPLYVVAVICSAVGGILYQAGADD